MKNQVIGISETKIKDVKIRVLKEVKRSEVKIYFKKIILNSDIPKDFEIEVSKFLNSFFPKEQIELNFEGSAEA